MDTEIHEDQGQRRLGPSRDDEIHAAINKESFKAMFYLFAGRPDSKSRLFYRKIAVKPEDIVRLNEKVSEKLKLHQTESSVTSVSVKISKQETIQFGFWGEFLDFDWGIAETTQEVTIRWDFTLNLDGYKSPQRHTMTVKISGAPNPREVFQILLSQDPDEDQDFGAILGPCLARVDFISHRLADELIDVVARWNESLPEPAALKGWFLKLRRYDKVIARTVSYSTPALMTLLALAVLGYFIEANDTVITNATFLMGLRMLLVGGIVIYSAFQMGRALANRCFSAIHEYGTFTPFRLTRGDRNLVQKNKDRNKSKILRFLVGATASLLINVLAAILVWYFL